MIVADWDSFLSGMVVGAGMIGICVVVGILSGALRVG
jgi:hypothetical protein